MNKIRNSALLPLIFGLSFSWTCYGQMPENVLVDVNLDVRHSTGGIDQFDRAKFVAIHADATEAEWDGDNEISDLRNDFLNGYDVYMGRNTGGITWYLNNQITEDPSRPGFANPASVTSVGQTIKNNYAAKTQLHSYENRNEQIMCAQLHPFWPDGKLTNKNWALSTADTQLEPLGTATGEYMGRYIRDAFGTGGVTGQPKPVLTEVINEPLWELVDVNHLVQPEKVFRFHNAVASEVKKYNSGMLVGGYCSAFPDVEKNDFAEWHQRWKLFMDIAGENMDFWAIHLYDFPAIGGKQRYRKGAQMEAMFDLMEQYSYLKFGVVKPFLISEYGAQMHDYKGTWSPYRDWLHMKSVNAMMLQFMDRPNLIAKAINFLIVKAEWGYNNTTGATYDHRLMRKKNEPSSYTGQWIYTDMLKIYQLWSNVNGIRVDVKDNHPDILTDSYVDGQKLYLLVNNLDLVDAFSVKPNLLGIAAQPTSLRVKHLYNGGTAPVMADNTYTEIPASIELKPEGTLVLEYTFPSNVVTDETSVETKYYATEYLKPIVANQDLQFTINNVQTGSWGEAILRIGIGRSLDKQRFPVIKLNGTALSVPNNYMGDDQADRASFFGLLTVNVPYDLLQANNTITITFPDQGGYVSSISMQTYAFSRAITRFAGIPNSSSVLKRGQIHLHPNPASETVRFSFDQDEPPRYAEFFNMSGELVLSQQLGQGQTEMNVRQLSNGVYLVRLRSDKSVYSQKLTVCK